MAKSPNTTPSKWSMSSTYNYKYPGWTEQNPFISAIFQAVEEEATKLNEQDVAVQNELAWLDYVDNEFITDMETYPDAESIIKKIMKKEN